MRKYIPGGLMLAIAVAGVAGCGSSGTNGETRVVVKTVTRAAAPKRTHRLPDFTNEKLDVAESDAEEAHVKVKVVGGGTFGVLDPSNWMVCEQRPDPGATATRVRLIVERSCE